MAKVVQQMSTDPVVLAYAAGLFDGEGCVLIVKWYSKKNKRSYHRLDVSLGQKDPRPVVWMRQHFGGRIAHPPSTSWKGNTFCTWIINNKAAGEFIALIRPYLILKGEQADVALAFRATVAAKTGNIRITGGWGKTAFVNPNLVDEKMDAVRDELREKLSHLKVVKG
jgi:hypothetical protein